MNATTPLDLAPYWMPFTHNRYFKQRPKLVASGAGAYLTLTDGRKVFDCLSGLWCTPLGHSHPEIVAAIHWMRWIICTRSNSSSEIKGSCVPSYSTPLNATLPM